jgi:hypothetical protein
MKKPTLFSASLLLVASLCAFQMDAGACAK